MKLHKLLIFTIYLFTYNIAKPYIVSLDALKKKTNKKLQFIINAGDVHLGCSNDPDYKHPKLSNKKLVEINKKHAQKFINFTKKYPKKECLFILENMDDYQGKNPKIKDFFDPNWIKQYDKTHNLSCCMSFISDHCKQNKLPMVNVEFRHSEDVFFDFHSIKCAGFLFDFYSLIKEIRNYDDGKVANQYYAKLISKLFKNNSKLLKIFSNNKNKYFNQFKKQVKNKDLEKFYDDYWRLLDARIVHTILKHKNKKYIFICSGIWHAPGINHILTKCNYQKIKSSKVNDEYIPLNLKNNGKKFSSLK